MGHLAIDCPGFDRGERDIGCHVVVAGMVPKRVLFRLVWEIHLSNGKFFVFESW